MPIRAILAVLALTLASAPPVRAAATPEPLPEHIEAHIALNGAYGCLGNMDTYIAAATKGTTNAIPPGFVSMIAQMYLPIPFDTWDSDGELHILIPRAEEDDDVDDIEFVVVFGTQDFPAFIESLEDRDWLVGEAGDKGAFADVRPVVVPGAQAMVVADLGGGRAALGLNVTSITNALQGWTPASASDADVFVQMAMGADGARFRKSLLDMLREEQEKITDAITGAGFKADFSRNLLATMEKAIPMLADELSAMKSVVIELDFDRDTLVIDMGAHSSADALVGGIGRTLTAGKAVDTAVGGGLPAGAISAVVSARMADLIPDAENSLARFASLVYGGIIPEYRDDITAAIADYMASGPGETAAGSYIERARSYSFTMTRAKDPEKLLAVCNRMITLFNTMWAAAIDDPGLGLTLSGGLAGEGEKAYYHYRPVFADEAKFQALLDRMTEGRADLDIDVQQFKQMQFFLAKLDDGMFAASGELSDETFVSGLAEARSAAGTSLLNSPKAEDLLGALPSTQGMAGIIDAGGFSRVYALQLARNNGVLTPEETANMARALEHAGASERPGVNLIGFSIGGESGWLTSRVLLPAGAVGRVVRDVERLFSVDKTAQQEETPVPDPTGTPDEYEDDLEEEEPEDDDAEAA